MLQEVGSHEILLCVENDLIICYHKLSQFPFRTPSAPVPHSLLPSTLASQEHFYEYGVTINLATVPTPEGSRRENSRTSSV